MELTQLLTEEAKRLVTSLWVSIKHLLIEYKAPEILISIGNSLGKTVALDGRMGNQVAISRICIEMEISTKTPTTMEVNIIFYQVSLENSHLFTNILRLYFRPKNSFSLFRLSGRPEYTSNGNQFQHSIFSYLMIIT